jgi:hypothetical protein
LKGAGNRRTESIEERNDEIVHVVNKKNSVQFSTALHQKACNSCSSVINEDVFVQALQTLE